MTAEDAYAVNLTWFVRQTVQVLAISPEHARDKALDGEVASRWPVEQFGPFVVQPDDLKVWNFATKEWEMPEALNV